MIDRYRADATVAPNFAYELVARRVSDDDVARLDLSSLRIALNGAEPIRPRTLDAVIDRLGEAGFRPDAFVCCYGMAEVTLLATASAVGQRSALPRRRPRGLRAGRGGPGRGGRRRQARQQRRAGRRRRPDRRPGDPSRAARRHRRRDLAARRQRRARVLAAGGGDRGDVRRAHRHGRGPVPAHRRPRPAPRRRALRHRPAQGPADRQRSQHLPAGHRGDRPPRPSGADRCRPAWCSWWTPDRSTSW